MNKLSALRVLSLGVIALCCAGDGLAVAAGVNAETSGSGGTTTYFPSNEPAATAPAASTASDSDKAATDNTAVDKSAADKAAAESAAAPPASSTAAVTPPAEAKPATETAPATETPATAAATPPSTTPPAPADAVNPGSTPTTAPTDATSAKPETQSPPPAAAEAAPPAPVNAVVEAARKKLADKSLVGKNNLAADVTAAAEFYNGRTAPLWITNGAYNEKAKSVISDLRNAGDWGLEASDFIVPALGSGANHEEQGAAEAQLTLSALKYARFARGGRLDPVELSNILDMKPPVKNPKVVMKELADSSHPGPFCAA